MQPSKRFGIMQGRLTRPEVGQELQFFPKTTWKQEFELAKNLGFKSIEGVIDSSPLTHPIFSEEFKNFIRALNADSPRLETLCLHEFVRESFWAFSEMEKLISKSASLGVKRLVIPLEGESVATNISREEKIKILKAVDQIAQENNIEMLFETNDLDFYFKLLEAGGFQKLFLNFDTGNLWHEKGGEKTLELLKSCGKRVHGIHLKDKSPEGKNVPFGQGIVDFSAFFRAVEPLNLDAPFVFESFRGPADDPVVMAQTNLSYVQAL